MPDDVLLDISIVESVRNDVVDVIPVTVSVNFTILFAAISLMSHSD